MSTATLNDSALRNLSARFQGELIDPAHAGYEQARKVWNGMVDRRPALIARCTNTNDVVAALRFARDQNLSVAVRGVTSLTKNTKNRSYSHKVHEVH